MYIRTKWLAPTNTKGSRIVARTLSGQRLTVHWNPGKNVPGNHAAAAEAAVHKFGLDHKAAGWEAERKWVGVENEDMSGYIFICTAAPYRFIA